MEVSNLVIIKHLETVDEMMVALPLIHQIYENVDEASYRANIEEMIRVNNYKMIGVFHGNKIIGVCGYWVLLMLYCGRYIQISNFVVDEDSRSLGVGKRMMKYIENLGRKMGCQKFVLDSYTENKKSHNLYFSEGFYIRGFHFMKDL